MEICSDKHLNMKIKNELLGEGINLDKSNYYQLSEYRKYRLKYIKLEKYGEISYDYYIEKVILTQERINEIRHGKYDIGTKRKYKESEMTKESLYQEIYDEEGSRADAHKRSPSVEAIKGKIAGANNKGGIIKKLKNIMNFNISAFSDEYSKLKLLKLLYRFIKDDYYGEKVNIMLLLDRPTLENIDEIHYGLNNTNGRTLALLKNELIKEINIEQVLNIRKTIYNMYLKWEHLLQVSVYYSSFHEKLNSIDDLNRLAQFLETIIVPKLPNVNDLNIQYEHGVFETFYLKVLQHEYICFEKDFIKINEHNYNRITKNLIKVKQIEDSFFDLEKLDDVDPSLIESYITNNIDALAKAIFSVKNISNENRDFIVRNIKKVEIILKWFEEHTTSIFNDKLPWLFIVACYQAFYDASETKESFNYSYYKAKKSGETDMMSKLREGDSVEEIYHWLWIKKIHFIYACLSGKNEVVVHYIRIEKCIDTIMNCIMLYPNLQNMCDIHDFFYSQIKRSFIQEKYAISECKRIAKPIYYTTGYRIGIYHANTLNLFKDTYGMNDNMLIKIFCELIRRVESKELPKELGIPIEGTNSDKSNRKSYLLKVEIDIKNKEFKLINCNNVLSDELCEYYKKLGIGGFIKF